MQNHLDLWSLKVDDNAIKLNIIYKYTDVRKNYPKQSSQGADWRQVNGVNRGVVEGANTSHSIDDASTHGKFMSLYKKSIKVEWSKRLTTV